MISVNQSSGATRGQRLDAYLLSALATTPAPAPAPAPPSFSLSAVAAAAASQRSDGIMVAIAPKKSLMDSESLVAAYLSRQESGPARQASFFLGNNEAVAEAPARPRNVGLRTQMAVLNSVVSARPFGSYALRDWAPIEVPTCSDAIALIRRHGQSAPFDALRIGVANDEGLALFAEAMRDTQHPPIHLGLDRQEYAFTAVGLQALAPVKLKSLSIERASFFSKDYEALADVEYGVVLQLARPKRYTQSVPGYGSNTVVERTPYLQSAISLRALEVLEIRDPSVSDAELMAIKNHPNLRAVLVAVPIPKIFRVILSNPRIEKLGLVGSELREARLHDPYAFQGISCHPSLKVLCINVVDAPTLLFGIGANTKIATLNLGVSSSEIAEIRYLANMPALHHLFLRASQPNVVLDHRDIRALCEKPLQTLVLHGFKMDVSAVSAAVRAHASTLRVSAEHITFSSTDVDALCGNKAVGSLLLGGSILAADAARLAALPTLTTFRLMQSPSATAVAANQGVKQAWIAAGKPLSHLHLGSLTRQADVGRCA